MLCSRFLHLAIVAAACAAAPYGVQAQQARFFTPLTDAGSHQQSQGLYGSLEALYWNISPGKETQIGYTNPDGGTATRAVYSGGSASTQQNSLTSSVLGEGNAALGMRFEIGNVRDHHGWLISGYGLPSQTAEKTVTGNTSMVIQDDGYWENARFLTSNTYESSNVISWFWDPQHEVTSAKGEGLKTFQQWGPFSGTTMFNRWDNSWSGGEQLGPGWQPADPFVPVSAANPSGALYWQGFDLQDGNAGFGFNRRVSIYELTNYQVLPGALWGYVPLTTEQQGYYEIDAGSYVELNRATTYYGVAPLPVIFTDIAINNRTTHWSTEAMYTYRLHPLRGIGIDFLAGLRYCELDDDFSLAAGGEYQHHYQDVFWGDANIPVSVFNTLAVDSSSYNRIVGPQFGVRIQRNNERWAALAEFRFFTGFNNIEMKNQGFFSSASNHSFHQANSTIVNYVGTPSGQISQGQPSNFKYRRVHNEFSPGFEFRLNSSWQLTRQIGLQIGFTTLVVDRVIRGAAVNEYRINSDNQFFGIRNDKEMFSTLVTYGLNIGLVVNRF